MNHGSYEYEDLPIFIGPLLGDGTTVYEFVVTDIEFQDCSNWTAIDPVDCNTLDCIIGDLETTILPCNEDDEFFVLLDFEYANTSDGFSVQGNGTNYGNFLYASLPVEIGPLIADGETVYEFLVLDDVHEGCVEDTYIDPVNCDSLTQLINFSTMVVSCADEMYELQFDFEVVSAGEEGFVILGNGEDYGTYDYSELPVTIGPLETDGFTPYHFIALDRKNMQSGNWDKLIPFTCESLGINDVEDKAGMVIVFPNPSNGMISFENKYAFDVEVAIYNSAGSLIKSILLSDHYQINDLETGLYFYNVLLDKIPVSNGKILISR